MVNYFICTSRVFVDKAEVVICSIAFTSWVLTLTISFNFVKNVEFICETVAGCIIARFILCVVIGICANQKLI